ncbi:MAG: hypothetical protein ACREQ5_08355 [Candidatus Dormibacteria bacterium]
MAFAINDFISNLNANDMVAHANMFDVIIALPPGLGSGQGAAKQLALQCENAEFPGIDIQPIEYRHHAFIKRIPFHLIYSPLTLTFLCTGAMSEKQLFDNWMNLCVPNVNGLVPYRLKNGVPQYETTITINQYDLTGRYTYFAQAQEAFPTSVSQLVTNWQDDSIHRLTVTFMFTKWLSAQDGATGQSTPVQQSESPYVSNFGNDLNSIVNGTRSLFGAQDRARQNQALKQLDTTSLNIFSGQ